MWHSDVDLQTFLPLAVKMDKTAHRMEQSPCDRDPNPQASCKTAAPGIRLVKIITYLRELGLCHPDPCVTDIDEQVDPVALPPIPDADIDPALFCKFDRIFQQDLQDMGELLHIPDQDRRYVRIDIKYDLQLLPVALHGGHRDDVIDHRSDHIGTLGGDQRPLHDLRIVQHIIDLVGQTLARHLYGLHL